MAKKIAAAPALQPVLSTETSPTDAVTFRSYTSSDPSHPGFSFTRYWWEKGSPREGISSWVRKKMKPGDDPMFGNAAKVEVLLPAAAPSDYACADFLVRRFDETLPSFAVHAMVQVKIALSPAEPWHVGYEYVRGYARTHFASRFPVILAAHVPARAGLVGYGSHIHCIVPARPLGINGFDGACHQLCSDRGYAAALAAWQNYLESDEVRP